MGDGLIALDRTADKERAAPRGEVQGYIFQAG